MARILYSVHGEGLGHASRAHSVANGLLQRGHDVQFVSSLIGAKYLRDHFPNRVHEIFGPSLYYDHGQVMAWKTVTQVAKGLARYAGASIRKLGTVFDEYAPEMVITDAESFTPTMALCRRVPFVSLDNQHLLTHCDIERPPGTLRDFINAYAVVRLYHVGAQHYFISTFVDAPIRYQPASLVPPIIRDVVYRQTPTTGHYLVAYLGGLGDHRDMQRVLESCTTIPIRAYGFHQTGQFGSATYMPMSSDGFIRDLAGAAGVIASAGHSLIGECLVLGKPMLLIPFAGQFEQTLNVHHITQLGIGMGSDRLSQTVIDNFVEHLDRYRRAIACQPKPRLEPILDALEREFP